MEKSRISGIDAFSILVKWRKFIIINFFIFSITAAAVSLILPKWYTSNGTLLPPEQQGMGGIDIMSLLGDMPFNLPNLPGIAGPSDVYVAILRSRNVREAVINDLNLKDIFETTTMADALEILDGLTKIDKTEENIIVISTTARSRTLAAEMARSFIKHLDRVNQTTRVTSARYTREFIEERLQQTDEDLHNAAAALRDFQKEYKVISIEEQTKAAITTAAELEAELALTEVTFNIARRHKASDHPDILELSSKVEELRRQIHKIELGVKQDTSRYLLPFSDLPDLGMQYAFLYRDVEVQKFIYKFLMQQYEQAKIQETKDTPTIQILDEPQEPEKRSKPKRAIITIITAILSFFVSGAFIFSREYLYRLKMRDAVSYRKITDAWEAVKDDFRRLMPGKYRK